MKWAVMVKGWAYIYWVLASGSRVELESLKV